MKYTLEADWTFGSFWLYQAPLTCPHTYLSVELQGSLTMFLCQHDPRSYCYSEVFCQLWTPSFPSVCTTLIPLLAPSLLVSQSLPRETRAEEVRRRHKESRQQKFKQNETSLIPSRHFKTAVIQHLSVVLLKPTTVIYDLCQMSIIVYMRTCIYFSYHIHIISYHIEVKCHKGMWLKQNLTRHNGEVHKT